MISEDVEAISVLAAGRTVQSIEYVDEIAYLSANVLRINFTDGSLIEYETDFVNRIQLIPPL